MGLAQTTDKLLVRGSSKLAARTAAMICYMRNLLRGRVLAPVGVLAVLLGGLAASPSALAAADTTGPTVSVNAISSFVLGQQTGDPFDDGFGLWFADRGAYRVYKWTAKDPSGICRYTIDEEHTVEGWTYEVINTPTRSTSGKYTFFADEYENSDDLSRIRINAYDCAGNVTSVIRPGDYVHVDRWAQRSMGWQYDKGVGS